VKQTVPQPDFLLCVGVDFLVEDEHVISAEVFSTVLQK